MIVQAFLDLIAMSIVAAVQTLSPLPVAISDAFSAVPGQVQSIGDWVSNLGPVIPFAQVNLGLSIVLGGYAVAALFAIAGKVLSLSTGGGGR